jgi:phosphoribosyl-AMP cyclohydrolase
MAQPDFDKSENGLLPAIAQDYKTGEILMQAYMNRESWEATLKSGYAVYYSRSRQELWKKGATSGHLQEVKEIRLDCDLDSIILKVHQIGGIACHTGKRSCFFNVVPFKPNE